MRREKAATAGNWGARGPIQGLGGTLLLPSLPSPLLAPPRAPKTVLRAPISRKPCQQMLCAAHANIPDPLQVLTSIHECLMAARSNSVIATLPTVGIARHNQEYDDWHDHCITSITGAALNVRLQSPAFKYLEHNKTFAVSSKGVLFSEHLRRTKGTPCMTEIGGVNGIGISKLELKQENLFVKWINLRAQIYLTLYRGLAFWGIVAFCY